MDLELPLAGRRRGPLPPRRRRSVEQHLPSAVLDVVADVDDLVDPERLVRRVRVAHLNRHVVVAQQRRRRHERRPDTGHVTTAEEGADRHVHHVGRHVRHVRDHIRGAQHHSREAVRSELGHVDDDPLQRLDDQNPRGVRERIDDPHRSPEGIENDRPVELGRTRSSPDPTDEPSCPSTCSPSRGRVRSRSPPTEKSDPAPNSDSNGPSFVLLCRLIALDRKSTSCFDAGSGFTSIGFDCLASWTSCSGAVSVSGSAVGDPLRGLRDRRRVDSAPRRLNRGAWLPVGGRWRFSSGAFGTASVLAGRQILRDLRILLRVARLGGLIHRGQRRGRVDLRHVRLRRVDLRRIRPSAHRPWARPRPSARQPWAHHDLRRVTPWAPRSSASRALGLLRCGAWICGAALGPRGGGCGAALQAAVRAPGSREPALAAGAAPRSSEGPAVLSGARGASGVLGSDLRRLRNDDLGRRDDRNARITVVPVWRKPARLPR